MLELVKEQVLDCIIVKDFSRFSRDYIELGSYIDQIFPFMGIRFISVNDGYDSNESNGGIEELDISFKNLLYDLYSKDLSIKVKSSLAARKQKGLYVSGNCPFGYEKAPDDRHMLIIQEQEAVVVRRIFQMRMEGMSSTQIAKAFNKEGIPTPQAFKRAAGTVNRVPKGGEFLWGSDMVCQITRNEMYTGDMIYGKYAKNEVGGKSHLKPRNEWKVVREHHVPIISREMFEAVQKRRGREALRKAGEKGDRSEMKHPLTGKLVCECCGRNLCIRKGLNPYFACPCRYVGQKEGCVKNVNVMFLEQYVLYEMQHMQQESVELTREIVQKWIDKIVVRDEGHMHIYWNAIP